MVQRSDGPRVRRTPFNDRYRFVFGFLIPFLWAFLFWLWLQATSAKVSSQRRTVDKGGKAEARWKG